MIDNSGHEVVPNDHVCFNWSGQIAYGVVLAVTHGTRYGKPYVKYVVRRIRPVPSPGKEYSTITNPKNLMAVLSFIP